MTVTLQTEGSARWIKCASSSGAARWWTSRVPTGSRSTSPCAGCWCGWTTGARQVQSVPRFGRSAASDRYGCQHGYAECPQPSCSPCPGSVHDVSGLMPLSLGNLVGFALPGGHLRSCVLPLASRYGHPFSREFASDHLHDADYQCHYWHCSSNDPTDGSPVLLSHSPCADCHCSCWQEPAACCDE